MTHYHYMHYTYYNHIHTLYTVYIYVQVRARRRHPEGRHRQGEDRGRKFGHATCGVHGQVSSSGVVYE